MGGTTVYASRNGATAVSSWKVLAEDGTGGMEVVASAPKGGFETNISVKGKFKTFEVEAVNSKGRVIGTSKSFSPPVSGGVG